MRKAPTKGVELPRGKFGAASWRPESLHLLAAENPSSLGGPPPAERGKYPAAGPLLSPRGRFGCPGGPSEARGEVLGEVARVVSELSLNRQDAQACPGSGPPGRGVLAL